MPARGGRDVREEHWLIDELIKMTG